MCCLRNVGSWDTICFGYKLLKTEGNDMSRQDGRWRKRSGLIWSGPSCIFILTHAGLGASDLIASEALWFSGSWQPVSGSAWSKRLCGWSLPPPSLFRFSCLNTCALNWLNAPERELKLFHFSLTTTQALWRSSQSPFQTFDVMDWNSCHFYLLHVIWWFEVWTCIFFAKFFSEICEGLNRG
jgi:hypothetical protein